MEIPAGFERIARRRLRLVIRSDVRAAIAPLLEAWGAGNAPTGRPLPGGRGGVRAIDLKDGLSVVLRPSRRGGLMGRINHEHYFGFDPRPFRELGVSEYLRRAGVATVEVLAAAIHWSFVGVYRGAVVTREMTDAVNLWEYLQRVPPADRSVACAGAAAATRHLHQAGAVHPDLNLTNYLVRRSDAGLEVAIIDCDGVRLQSVTMADRQAAFDRLCRSVRKLDPMSAIFTLECVDALRRIVADDA